MHGPKLHAVMLSSPGMGHVIPVIELAKRLSTNHGFHVTVFVLETNKASAQSKFLDSPGCYDPTAIDVVELPTPDISGLVEPDDHIVITIGAMMREVVPYFRSGIAALNLKPTAMIIDLFGTDSLCLAAEFNMLSYVLIASNARFLAVCMYYPTLERDVKDEHINERKALDIPGCEPLLYRDTLDSFEDPEGQLYREFTRHGLAYPTADGILVNSWEEMEYKTLKSLQDPKLLGRIARVPVYPIGPLCRPVDNSATDHPVFDWLNNQPDESVLYISFGSGGSLTAKQLTELAWGLELSQQRFVWVVRPPVDGSSSSQYFSVNSGGITDTTPEYLPEGFVTRTSDRGLVVPSWAPQAEVLAHRAVGGFLSHCGWNSTLESVVSSVPIIGWPLFAEQSMNATLISDEVGIAIRADEFAEEGVICRSEIEAIVRKIMVEEEGDEMRSKVKKLKETGEMSLSSDGGGGGTAYESLRRVTEECERFLERVREMAGGA